MIKSRYSAAITDKPWWRAGGIPHSGCVIAYQPKGATSRDASLINLVNPGTYNAVAVGANPTWDNVNGWKFVSGSSVAISTTLNLNDGYSIIFKFSNVTNNGTLGGSYNYSGSTGGILIFPNTASKILYYCPGSVSVSPALTDGVVAIAGNNCYRNGLKEGAGSGAIPLQTNCLYIGANFNISSITNQLTGYIQAVAVYSIPLTAAHVASLVVAMNSL